MFAMGPAFFGRASAPATLALTGTFAAATVGAAYSSSITISGGVEPYALTGGTGISAGSLDSGFSLSITGSPGARLLTLACASPATADTMTFTASVGSTDGQTATNAQSVVVAAAGKWYTPLFASGEQGLVFDFNDLTSLFQDTAHAVPVTAVGQTIKAIRDQITGAYATQNSGSVQLAHDATRGLYYGTVVTAAASALFIAAGAMPSSFLGDGVASMIGAATFTPSQTLFPIIIGSAGAGSGVLLGLGNLSGTGYTMLQQGSGLGVTAAALSGTAVAIGVKPALSGGSHASKIYANGSLSASNATGVANITTSNAYVGGSSSVVGAAIYSAACVNRELTTTEIASVSANAL